MRTGQGLPAMDTWQLDTALTLDKHLISKKYLSVKIKMYFKECYTWVPLCPIYSKEDVWLLPVYSATEAKEEAADAVSQSRSVLLLGLRLRMGKASSDSTLQVENDKML